MRKRITKSNRWKKVAKATLSGAAAGAGIGGLHGGLQEHLKIKPKFEKVKPAFDLLGKGDQLKTLKKFQISKVAGGRAIKGSIVGAGAGALISGGKELLEHLKERRKLRKLAVRYKKNLKG